MSNHSLFPDRASLILSKKLKKKKTLKIELFLSPGVFCRYNNQFFYIFFFFFLTLATPPAKQPILWLPGTHDPPSSASEELGLQM
jgi:hypothetical protein